MTLSRRDPRHGTINGYSNLRCRCQKCKDAWAEYIKKRRHERMALAAAGKIPKTVKHGLDTTYSNWRCKCRPCLNAHARARRRKLEKDA